MEEKEQSKDMNLKDLETRAKIAMEQAEHSWQQFAAIMSLIQEHESYKEAGYSSFSDYYKAEWQEQTRKAYQTIKTMLDGFGVWHEFREKGITTPSGYTVAAILKKIGDSSERERFWKEVILPEHPDGRIGTAEMRTAFRNHYRVKDLSLKDLGSLKDLSTSTAERKIFREIYSLHATLHVLNPEEVAAQNKDRLRKERTAQINSVTAILDWLSDYRTHLEK